VGKGSHLDGYDSDITAEQLHHALVCGWGPLTKDGGQPLRDDIDPEGVHETQAVNDAAAAFEEAYAAKAVQPPKPEVPAAPTKETLRQKIHDDLDKLLDGIGEGLGEALDNR
jgi:hypothetical protein